MQKNKCIVFKIEIENPVVDGNQKVNTAELDETLISKFPAEKQAKIKELYKENPELINKFLKETIIDVNGNMELDKNGNLGIGQFCTNSFFIK